MTKCVLAMPGNETMAAAIARELGCNVADAAMHRFPDGETSLRIHAELDGRDVAVVCTLDYPDDKLASLLFAAALCRDLGAASVGLLAPYLAYMRQDTRFNLGESVTARYFAHVLSANFDWLVTADPHLHRIATLESVYTIPATAVRAAPAIGGWIRKNVQNPGLVGPDAESRQWVSEVAGLADAPFLVLEKTRRSDTDVSVSAPDSDWLRQCTPIIVDDIASTGKTLEAAIQAVAMEGGASPLCIVVHALFVGDAFDRLQAAGATRVLSCNTVGHASNEILLDRDLAAATQVMFERMAKRRSAIPR